MLSALTRGLSVTSSAFSELKGSSIVCRLLPLPESASSSYICSPGPSGVIQHTVMPIFQPDPCMGTCDGNTALHGAVMEDLPEICMMLTNAGADPNIVNFAQQSGLSDDEVPIDHTSVRDEDSATVSKGASAFDMASLNASVPSC